MRARHEVPVIEMCPPDESRGSIAACYRKDLANCQAFAHRSSCWRPLGWRSMPRFASGKWLVGRKSPWCGNAGSAIHFSKKDVDGRDKPGHDVERQPLFAAARVLRGGGESAAYRSALMS
jgi:hypothetical protein